MIHVTLQDLKRLLKVRCFAILFLFFVQLVLSQQSTTSIVLNRDTLDLGQKPILLNEVVVSTMIAGYLYPNTEEELTDAVDKFEKK